MENGVYIFPEPEEFLRVMEELQKAYNEKQQEE